jgi:hypothetical protein
MRTNATRRHLAAIALTLAAASGCSAFTASTPAPPTATPDPATQPYPRGQFTVTQPKRALGVDLCAQLPPPEKTTLVGPHPVVYPGSGGQCDLHGDHGDVLIGVNTYNVDVASELDLSDRPGHRDTLSGNSAWVTPSSIGCFVQIAIDPEPHGLVLGLGGDGRFTCDQLRHAAQLVLDRLPPKP